MGISYEELEKEKSQSEKDLGAGGQFVHRQTKTGALREQIIKYGLHDRIMSNAVVMMAIRRSFLDSNALLAPATT